MTVLPPDPPADPPTDPTPEPAPEPTPSPSGRRPRRRTVVIGASVLGVLVLAGVLVALLVPGHGPRGAYGDHWGRGGRGGPESSFGGLGELGFDAAPGPGGPGGPDGRGGPGGPGDRWESRGGPGFGAPHRPLGDDTLLVGTVVSAGDGSLVLTPDGAAQRMLLADDDTRVFGGDDRAVRDLTAGERVVLRVDGTGDSATVVAAAVPRARVAGTVTALTGDQATVVAVDGLTVTADVTGIGRKPAVGDLVVVTGGASGATLRADELRVLPKTP